MALYIVWPCGLHLGGTTSTKDVYNLFSDNYGRNALLKLNYQWPHGKEQALNQILWYNSEILIKGIPICWRKWFDCSILLAEDIVNLDDSMKNWEEICQPELNWLDWQSITATMPPMWKICLRNTVYGHVRPSLVYREIMGKTKITKFLNQSISVQRKNCI